MVAMPRGAPHARESYRRDLRAVNTQREARGGMNGMALPLGPRASMREPLPINRERSPSYDRRWRLCHRCAAEEPRTAHDHTCGTVESRSRTTTAATASETPTTGRPPTTEASQTTSRTSTATFLNIFNAFNSTVPMAYQRRAAIPRCSEGSVDIAGG